MGHRALSVRSAIIFLIAVFHLCPLYSEQLSILFILRQFPEPYQTFYVNQLRGFMEEGHDVTILSLLNSPYPLAPELEEFELRKQTYYKNLPQSKRSFDIIYSSAGYIVEDCVALIKKQKLEGCFIVGIHTTPQESHTSPLVDHYLPVCEYFAHNLIENGVDPDKIHVHHCGIDLERFHDQNREVSDDGTIRLLTVSRLDPIKGFQYAIPAVADLLKKYNITYTIIGDGPYRSKLKKLIRKLRVDKHVLLKGYQPPDNVITELLKSHVFLHPSYSVGGRTEGCPMSIAEAMAMQVPVVATWHGGIPELVSDCETGLLVPEGDSEKLAEAIAFILDNPELSQNLGIAGRLKVGLEFEINAQNLKLTEIFREKAVKSPR